MSAVRTPVLPYSDYNPVTVYYVTEDDTILSLNEDSSFVLNEDDTFSEIDQSEETSL